MNESRDALLVSQSSAETAPNTLTFYERWAQWQEKGVRHDAADRVDDRVIWSPFRLKRRRLGRTPAESASRKDPALGDSAQESWT